jgi:cytochrome c-type biogenesis protein CcmH/NrfG
MHKQSRNDAAPPSNWTSREAYVLAVVCLLAGLAMGYLLRGTSAPVATAASAPAAPADIPAANPTASAVDADIQAAPLKMALTTDPRNFDLLVQLGNLYYDKQVFAPAIEYYRRALEVRPSDVSVRTDLGTAYWYSGFPQNAIAEYKKSLQVDPGHAQTLFNMGVVYRDGMKDPTAAVATWQKLLKSHPDHPDRQRILGMIDDAKRRNS